MSPTARSTAARIECCAPDRCGPGAGVEPPAAGLASNRDTLRPALFARVVGGAVMPIVPSPCPSGSAKHFRRRYGAVALAIVASVFVVSCSTGQRPESTTAPSSTIAEQQSREAALAAYDGFWRTTNQAFARPGVMDWRPELSKYASGQALDAVLTDIRNYASFPAHKEGEPARSPRVDSVSLGQPSRVVIMDCLDVRGVRLLADKTGADLGDTANQPPRFLYRAEVVQASGQERWLVEVTKPLLDRPC